VSATAPRFQFYGRRKGKPLRRHHADLMQSLLPELSLSLTEPLAGTGARRWLEIGFGGGEHLAEQAKRNPDVTLIGAEAFRNGVAKLLSHLESDDLKNVRIHYGDARELLEALPGSCLERIYLLYPDPWPKERQKKRRFISTQNLLSLARVLEPRGSVYFASDIEDYVEWTRVHVAQSGQFAAVYDSSAPFDDWHQTRYEAKAKREGRTPHYLIFEKTLRK
jgi:tRNA (guanine-N7-)-methyltransferase